MYIPLLIQATESKETKGIMNYICMVVRLLLAFGLTFPDWCSRHLDRQKILSTQSNENDEHRKKNNFIQEMNAFIPCD